MRCRPQSTTGLALFLRGERDEGSFQLSDHVFDDLDLRSVRSVRGCRVTLEQGLNGLGYLVRHSDQGTDFSGGSISICHGIAPSVVWVFQWVLQGAVQRITQLYSCMVVQEAPGEALVRRYINGWVVA